MREEVLMHKGVWREVDVLLTRLDNSMRKNTCLLLLKKINRVRHFKEFGFPRRWGWHLKGTSNHHWQFSLRVVFKLVAWCGESTRRRVKCWSDPWMWKVYKKGQRPKRKEKFLFRRVRFLDENENKGDSKC